MSKVTLDECMCKCGCKGNKTHPSFLRKLNDARDRTVVRFLITSGYRCPKHNKAEGGSDTSSHLTGWAVDIYCNHSYARFAIIEALLAAGFTRIGIAKTFIHVDDDPHKDKGVVWVY